jgi:hypothetical protein
MRILTDCFSEMPDYFPASTKGIRDLTEEFFFSEGFVYIIKDKNQQLVCRDFSANPRSLTFVPVSPNAGEQHSSAEYGMVVMNTPIICNFKY